MLQEAEYGVTDMALASPGGASGDEQLLVKFFMRPLQNDAKTREAGRPIFEEVPYVSIKQPGQKDSEVIAPASDRHKKRFPRHWQAFQARESQEAVSGTPLEHWSGITRSMVEELRFLNVHTVEQLANLSDANSQNIMGINALKQRAADWLESSDTEAASIALRESNEKIEMLLKVVEEQNTKIALLEQQIAE